MCWSTSRDVTVHLRNTEQHHRAVQPMQSLGFKARPSTVTFISFNYAERMTLKRGFCTCCDVSLSCGNISGQLYPHALPLLIQTNLSLSSSFHSLVNYIARLSPGLGGVGGTAGVVPWSTDPWKP